MQMDLLRNRRDITLLLIQQRTKWKTTGPNIQKNDVVLLLEDTETPGYWAFGRTVEINPDKDGLVILYATIKTKNSIFQKPIAKLLVIPLYKD